MTSEVGLGRPSSLLEEVLANPTLHPLGLTDQEKVPGFNWHSHVGSPRSSQVFALSAFGSLRNIPGNTKNKVVETFLRSELPDFPSRSRARRWAVLPEFERAEVLGEYGADQSTSIDILLESSKEVIAIESKFVTDAAHGFGGCGQVRKRKKCAGFHGPGSDISTGTSAWCRLENWEGRRSPRTYWAIGKQYFLEEVFWPQLSGQECPFAASNYQLMRNFLFAAAYAESHQKDYFAVVTIAPEAFAPKLASQVRAFQQGVLREEFREKLVFVTYEEYCNCLDAHSGFETHGLSEFLKGAISKRVSND